MTESSVVTVEGNSTMIELTSMSKPVTKPRNKENNSTHSNRE